MFWSSWHIKKLFQNLTLWISSLISTSVCDSEWNNFILLSNPFMWLKNSLFFSDNFKLQCGGKPIQITNGAITLSYYSTSPIARNTTCTVRVFSPISKYPANVIAYFRTFYTDYSQNCVNSRLDIFDSLETTGRAITGTNYKTLNNEALIYLNFSNDNGFFYHIQLHKTGIKFPQSHFNTRKLRV